jgi:hypothetical protein
MMHPGKPDRIRASIIGSLAMIGIVLLLETVGLAQRTDQKGSGITGFRELRWGSSIEQSSKIYAENAFAKMNGRLRTRYGDPSGHKVDYVTEFIVVVREATWIVGHSAITIKYEGAGRTNEDMFTLTMQEKRKR